MQPGSHPRESHRPGLLWALGCLKVPRATPLYSHNEGCQPQQRWKASFLMLYLIDIDSPPACLCRPCVRPVWGATDTDIKDAEGTLRTRRKSQLLELNSGWFLGSGLCISGSYQLSVISHLISSCVALGKWVILPGLGFLSYYLRSYCLFFFSPKKDLGLLRYNLQ